MPMSSASDFQRLHNGITTNLQKISNNVTDIESLVKKIGTTEDSETLRERYHKLQNDTKILSQTTNQALQQLNHIPVHTEAEQNRKKLLTESLPTQYLQSLNRFQQAQRLGVQKERESLNRARAQSQEGVTLFDNREQEPFGSTYKSPQQQTQAILAVENHVDLKTIHERDQQLRRLEGDIVQVNEIFKDVSKLVHEQGEIIDHIEVHIDTAQHDVQQASSSLKHAVGSQVRAVEICHSNIEHPR
ncbi:unnamed protein product [Didymodactylos carnosus]|uniref:t-SNARE coiled-coil homology domain-containing protein n=1 Tax=Didymodactylos carnosus TaxID=1234261 RepID=A0A813ZSR2_9BILA|nr:unnamed protein product [Didymodactylos carnosus]CAF1160369.1 unnamed protein product [Didymodactylos carnosus]CAF3684825.1 unnamed protein product [Didymodactylos carnosus]CAF3972021.1 unnamed protein product [Didymodactylos carnosus]